MHAFKRKKQKARPPARQRSPAQNWVSVGMQLTFRAEVMPGREPTERTFTVARVLAGGRVELSGLSGQHTETEFEPVT